MGVQLIMDAQLRYLAPVCAEMQMQACTRLEDGSGMQGYTGPQEACFEVRAV